MHDKTSKQVPETSKLHHGRPGICIHEEYTHAKRIFKKTGPEIHRTLETSQRSQAGAAYEINLPKDLKTQGWYPVFYASLLL
jgi:hypothetical protein